VEANAEEAIIDEVLIMIVKENPVLYDKKHKYFKNVELKAAKWKMVATGCGASSGGYICKVC